MSDTRRHHYVSQFYLRNFADAASSRFLYVIDKKENRDFKSSTVNVAQERDFHRVDIDGVAPNAVEDTLAAFEGAVATSMREIRQRQLVSRDEYGQTLIHYLALLLVKNPRTRSMINHLTNTILSEFGRREAANADSFRRKNGDSEETETLRQALLAGDYNVSLRNEGHLDTEFFTAPSLAPLLLQRTWNFVTVADGQFITCDHPVVLMRNGPGLLGVAHRDVDVFFPLSPSEGIIGAFDVSESVITASRENVAILNAKVAWSAYRQVFAQDKTFEYLASDGTVKPGPSILQDPHFVTLQEADEE